MLQGPVLLSVPNPALWVFSTIHADQPGQVEISLAGPDGLRQGWQILRPGASGDDSQSVHRVPFPWKIYCLPVGQPGSVSQSTNAPAACTALPSSPATPSAGCRSYILMTSFARLANIARRVRWSTASALIVLSLVRLYLAEIAWQHSPAARWQTAKKSCTGGGAARNGPRG